MGSQRVGHDWATSLSLSRIGEGNGNPLQCSCLENPRDGGAWWAAIYGSHRVRHGWSNLAAAAGNSLAIQGLALSAFTTVAWVQPLVGELRSHKPCSTAKKIFKKENLSKQNPGTMIIYKILYRKKHKKINRLENNILSCISYLYFIYCNSLHI